jgi:hypothetical protein
MRSRTWAMFFVVARLGVGVDSGAHLNSPSSLSDAAASGNRSVEYRTRKAA